MSPPSLSHVQQNQQYSFNPNRNIPEARYFEMSDDKEPQTFIAGVGGSEEHVLQNRMPWQLGQTHTEEDLLGEQQATEPLDSPPTYQAGLDRDEQTRVLLPQTENPDQGLPRRSTSPNQSPQPVQEHFGHNPALNPGTICPKSGDSTQSTPWRKPVALMVVAAISTAILYAWSVGFFVDQNARLLAEERTAAQGTFRRPKFRPLRTTFTPVSGLYLIPSPITGADWSRLRQGTSPTAGTSPNQGTRFHTTSEGTDDSAKLAHQEKALSNHWGVEVLYNLRRGALDHAFQIEKGWCKKNTCSPAPLLNAMCNHTKQKVTKYKDRFQEQECKWCWDENMFPRRNSTQTKEIEDHCNNVSHYAAIFLTIVCGILLLSTFLIGITLVMRMLRHRAYSIADRELHSSVSAPLPLYDGGNDPQKIGSPHPMPKLVQPPKGANLRNQIVHGYFWPLSIFEAPRKLLGASRGRTGDRARLQRKQPNRMGERPAQVNELIVFDKVPILPPAIGPRLNSDKENMGQGRLCGLNDNDGEDVGPEVSPRSSRYSRARGSGRLTVPPSVIGRKSVVAEHEKGDTGRSVRSATRSVSHG